MLGNAVSFERDCGLQDLCYKEVLALPEPDGWHGTISREDNYRVFVAVWCEQVQEWRSGIVSGVLESHDAVLGLLRTREFL